MKYKKFLLNTLFSIVGVLILSFGVAILNIGNVGVDPFTAFNIAVGGAFNITLGNFQLLMNIIMLVLLLVFGRKFLGLGTVISMTMIGYSVEFFTHLLDGFTIYQSNLIFKIVTLILGSSIFSLGISIYIISGLGVAPYDGLTLLIEDKTSLKYRFLRVIQDSSFTLVAFLFNGPIGIGTIISAFFTGPLIDFWYKIILKYKKF